MRTSKRIFCIITVVLALLADTSLIPFTGLNTAFCPRLCLITVITIGLMAGKTQGIIYGALAGLLLGFTIYTPQSFTLIIYVACGLIAGFFGRISSRYLITVLPVIIPLFVYEAAYAVYYYFSSTILPVSMLGNAAVRIGAGFLIAQIWYFPFSRVLMPRKQSRATPRMR